MVVKHIQRSLKEKSRRHQEELRRLGKQVEDEELSPKATVLEQTPQLRAMNTIIQNSETDEVDFIFYFDRIAAMLLERYNPDGMSHFRV